MAIMLENFGLDFLAEDEDTLMGFMAYITRDGKALSSYCGAPYIFKPMGDVEFWVRTEKNESGNLHVTGFDSHSANQCVWNLTHSGIDITPKESSKLERTALFSVSDTQGDMLPVQIITADVLPSWMQGDKVEAQMIALPLEIRYYADEEEYENDQPSDENGKKWLVATGSMVALNWLYNHSPERYEKESMHRIVIYNLSLR